MVCKNCEEKLGRVAAPDTWKAGARNTMESGGRKVGENKLLSRKLAAGGMGATGGGPRRRCVDCGQACHQDQATLCHVCAYSKGVCAICGVKILDTTFYRMTGASVATHKPRGPAEEDQAGVGNKRSAKSTDPTVLWVKDKKTGYLFEKTTKYYYDPATKLYFHHKRGKWME
ncbi:OCRE domain-containing protein [Chloropicon primus]|nr:OCRE domain-containing protein [Chloropicon primus]